MAKAKQQKPAESSRSLLLIGIWLGLAAVFLSLILGAGAGALLANMASHPPWYTYKGPPDSEEALLPPVDELLSKSWNGMVVDPWSNYGLVYETVSVPSGETWVSPVTGKETPLKLRGWLISAERIDEDGVSNEEKMKREFPHLIFDVRDNLPAGTARGVVGVHGAGVDRREMLRHLPMWIANGFDMIMVDCRDHGVSDGYARGPSYGLREQEDVTDVVYYAANTLGWDPLILFGSSQGGSSVLLGSARLEREARAEGRESPVKCVIAENPFADKRGLWREAIDKVLLGSRFGSRNLADTNWGVWIVHKVGFLIPNWFLDHVIDIALWKIGYGWQPEDVLDTLTHVGDITTDLMILHGTDDTVVPPSHSQKLFDAATGSKNKRLEWYDGCRHGMLINQMPEEYFSDYNEFVCDCLRDE